MRSTLDELKLRVQRGHERTRRFEAGTAHELAGEDEPR